MIITIFSLISGILLSIVSAYFSVIGFSEFFGGFIVPIIIMASFLEMAKIAAALWLHKHWKDGPKKIKNYLLFSVIILMFITSLGIFGFLSKTHSEINKDISIVSSQISNLENRLSSLTESKNFYLNNINSLDRELEILRSNNRITQSIQTRQRQQNERNLYLEKIRSIDDEILKIQNSITELKSQNIIQNVKLGPINYFISFMNSVFSLDINLDKASVIFIFLIIFVFDPVAICLLIAAHWSFMKYSNKNNIIDKKDNIVLFFDCFIQRVNMKFYRNTNNFILNDYFLIQNKENWHNFNLDNNSSLDNFSLKKYHNKIKNFNNNEQNKDKNIDSKNDIKYDNNTNINLFEQKIDVDFMYDYQKYNNISFDSEILKNKNFNFCEKDKILENFENDIEIKQDFVFDIKSKNIENDNNDNNVEKKENNVDCMTQENKNEEILKKEDKNENISDEEKNERNNNNLNKNNFNIPRKDNLLHTSEVEFNSLKWIVERPSLK